jgi:MFS family permease
LWSVLTAISGAARGFVSMAIPRMFIGVGESILTPTAMSMLADRFPASKLGFAAGFYYMGVPIGIGASLMIAGYLGPAIGWRNCFYALGAIGVVLALVMLFVKETPRKHLEQHTGDAPKQSFRELVGIVFEALKASPALRLTIMGGVATHLVLGAAVFDQLWYVQERGFERAEIAKITGWIGVFGGLLGNLVGGLGSDWWQKNRDTGRTMFLFWATLWLLPITLAYRLVAPDSPLFWTGVFCGFFQLGLFYGPTFSTVQELVPARVRSTVVAFYILALNMIGITIGVTLSGIAIDWMLAAGVAEPYSKTLFVFTVISGASVPLYYFAGKRFHADRVALYARMAG